MPEETKRIVEIDGVKIEVDLRNAKKVDSFKIGDPVKVLRKDYETRYVVEYGVIIDFTEFEKRPAIEILTISEYGEMRFRVFHAGTDLEIAPVNKLEVLFEKSSVRDKLLEEVHKNELELEKAKQKLRHFDEQFSKAFSFEAVTE